MTTGIVTEQIFAASQMLTQLTGEAVQANKAIVGRNAFAHEAGIHQDGMLKDRRTYEIMRPEDVGVPATTLVLGKHSGRHAVQHRVQQLGLELSTPRARSALSPDGRAGRPAEDGVGRRAGADDHRPAPDARHSRPRDRRSATSTARGRRRSVTGRASEHNF